MSTPQPHDVEAERAVLAGCMMSRDTAYDVMEKVHPGDFYVPRHEIIFASIHRVMATGLPADTITVVDDLIRHNELSQAGGPEYVHGVTDQIPIAILALHHADIVVDRATRRRLADAAARTLASVMSGEVSDLIEGARKGIDEATSERQQALAYVGDIVDSVLDTVDVPRDLTPTPWPALTDLLGGGLRKGALYTIAARPGIGKTAIALQLATMMAGAGPVAMSSLEMPKEELVRRLIAQGVHMPHHLLERGEALPEMWQRRVDDWKQRGPWSIAIDDRATVGFAEVRAHARAVQRTSGRIAGVVIDYLQLMTGPSASSRQEIVGENARQAKIMARDLDCPVILLSQLNRESEKRMDRRPMLSDLRESGAIEQDSDVVMLLYRDPSADEQPLGMPPHAVPLEFIIAKNRHGPTMPIEVSWEGSQMRAF